MPAAIDENLAIESIFAAIPATIVRRISEPPRSWESIDESWEKKFEAIASFDTSKRTEYTGRETTEACAFLRVGPP